MSNVITLDQIDDTVEDAGNFNATLHIIAQPGSGVSRALQDAVAKNSFIDIRLSMFCSQAEVEHAISEITFNTESPGVILLDEYDVCCNAVRSAAHDMMVFHESGAFKIPANFTVISKGQKDISSNIPFVSTRVITFEVK